MYNKARHWEKYLHWVEWNYNTRAHGAIGLTPFQVVYRKPPPSIPSYILGSSNIEAIDITLSTREEIFAFLHENMLKAQKQMKEQEDNHRTFYEFQPDDWVFLKLQLSDNNQ